MAVRSAELQTQQRSHNTRFAEHREIRGSPWFLQFEPVQLPTPRHSSDTPPRVPLPRRASWSWRVLTRRVTATRTWRRSIPPAALSTRPTARRPRPAPAAAPQLAVAPPATPSPSPRTRPWLSASATRGTREPAAFDDDQKGFRGEASERCRFLARAICSLDASGRRAHRECGLSASNSKPPHTAVSPIR